MRVVQLLLVTMVSAPALAEGLALEPWSGDAGLAAELDEGVRSALRRVHPRVVEVKGACDVDCVRALRVGGVVRRAARGEVGGAQCVEVALRPLEGAPRVFTACRADARGLLEALEAELPARLRGPLKTWEQPIADIRDEAQIAASEPMAPPAASPSTAADAGLTTTGAWTVGVGAAIAALGVGTAIGLLPILQDPAADRGAKDIALQAGRASLFAGVSLGIATSATGALLWTIGARGAP